MNNIVKVSAKIFRNIKDYKFVHKLTAEQKQEIVDLLSFYNSLSDNYSNLEKKIDKFIWLTKVILI